MRLRTITILVLLLAPSALAGTPDDPEVPGIPDQSDKTIDFLAAWFESAPDGVVFHVRFGGAATPPPNHFYAVSFDITGARLVAAVVFDSEGRTKSVVSPPNFNANNVGSPDRLGNVLQDIEFEAGTPATVSARIPWEAIPGLSPGDVLVDLYAGTGVYSRGWNDEDGRQTSNTYVIEKTYVPLFVQRNATWIVLGFALAGAGAAAAFLWWRKRAG